MSERGLILALQRIHDDPGFTGRVAEDPQGTLGLYDLEQEERDRLIQAVTNRDNRTIRQMASTVGIDWKADHIGSPGTLGNAEPGAEGTVVTGVNRPNALTGDGYEGVMTNRPSSAR